MASPPTIIIHNLTHALAALHAAEDVEIHVRLISAPGAAAYAGAAWFREVTQAARNAHPRARAEMVLDCGTEPGHALAALRTGIEAIRIKAPAPVLKRIEAIAQRSGSCLVDRDRAQPLDLLDTANPEQTARAWLNRRKR